MRIKNIVQGYCRAKGIEVPPSLCPALMIRDQLAAENHGLAHPHITSQTRVRIERLLVTSVIAPHKHHLDKIEPRPVVSDTDSTPPIAGVVLEKAQDLYLIDGYHRLKWMLANDVESGTYIVLTNPMEVVHVPK